jgi:hypothetical protein
LKLAGKISWYLVFVVAFVLGLKQLHEPDLWWMFRTGEWMVQNGQIPTTDVFSFTHKGVDWISVKWLFELIAYGIVSLAGPESISILQSFVNVILTYFFFSTVKDLIETIYKKPIKPYHPLLVFSGLIFLFSVDYRLVGRPEMFSYLLTMIYLSIFVKYKLKPGKFIFWLIPLQIIWVNIHEGFAVGMVMLAAFGIGHLFDYLITKKEDKKTVQTVLLATGLAFLAVAVNPRGFYMFYHPYFLFSVVGSNKYTTEFNSIFHRPEFYLSFKEPFLAFGALLIAIAGIGWLFIKNKLNLLSQVSSGYIALIFAFTYLGITAYRNTIFPIILLFPLALAFLIHNLSKWENKTSFKYITNLLYLLPILFYLGIVTNYYYKNFQPRDRYGLSVYADSNPSGAARFALDNNLSNQRCFSDYLTSAYFLWELRPGFESYIDLRDLDIFPKSFFTEFANTTYFTNYFEESDAKYQYQYAMLYTWQFPNLHRYLYHSPNWHQVYADNVAAVYVKNNDKNASIIQKYQMEDANLNGFFNRPYQPEASNFSNGISFTFWPLYNTETNHADSSISASQYFRIVADFDRAEHHAQNAINNNTSPYEGWQELGDMYLEISAFKKNSQDQIKYFNMAKTAYLNGYQLDKTREGCITGQAHCALNLGQYGYALKMYKKALKINTKSANTYVKIAQCYASLNQETSNQSNYDNWYKYMLLGYQLEPDNQSIIASLASAYCQDNKCENAVFYLEKYQRTPEISSQVHQQMLDCKKKCRVRK